MKRKKKITLETSALYNKLECYNVEETTTTNELIVIFGSHGGDCDVLSSRNVPKFVDRP